MAKERQLNLFLEPEIVPPYLSGIDSSEIQQKLEEIAVKACQFPLLLGQDLETPESRLSEIKHYLQMKPSLYLIRLNTEMIGAASIDDGGLDGMYWDDAGIRLAFIDPAFNRYQSFVKDALIKTCREIDMYKE